MVDVQTLGLIQVVETLEPHLQILVEVGDVVVVRFRLHNKPGHAMRRRCTLISSRHIRTGMYVFCVDLTSRTDIHRRHAPPLGDVRITKKVLIEIMRDNTLEQGTTRALRQCTRVSCQICDGVGQSRWKLNV